MLLLVALVIGQGVLASVQKAIFKKNPRELFVRAVEYLASEIHAVY
jgi:hypothetical protein